MGVLPELLRNRLAQSARTHPMHNADWIDLGKERIVEELVGHIKGFIHISSDDVDLGFFEVLR